MKSFKQIAIVIALIAIIFSLGCDKKNISDANKLPADFGAIVTDTNSLAANINNLAADANKVSVTVDQLQSAAKQVVTVLTAMGVDSNGLSSVNKISTETDKVQKVLDTIVAICKANNISANSDNISAVIALALQINSATASFNPYSSWVFLILTAAALIWGVVKNFQTKKATDTAATTQTAVAQIVTGVDNFLQTTADASAVAAFKAAQRDTQSAETSAMVAQLVTEKRQKELSA